MAEGNFTFRVEDELKTAFIRAAKLRNRNASILLRDFMQQFVATTDAETAAAKPSRKTKRPARANAATR